MRFVCLFHLDAERLAALSPAELEAFDHANRDADAALIASGHYVTALALAAPATAATVRRRDGTLSVTDGPYAETKEQLGGLLLIEARDRDEAIAIARQGPMADYGTITVWPELEIGWQRQQQQR